MGAEFMELNDAELMRRIEQRNSSALSALYDRHGPACLALAQRVLGDSSVAEDVVQELFVKVWEAPSAYQPARGTVKTWLITTARSRAIDALRKRRTRDRIQEQAGDEQPDYSLPPRRASSTVGRAVEGLPEDQRRVIELAYFEGLTQAEISDRLDMPLGTTKSRLRLGLSKLKQTFLSIRRQRGES